MPLASLKCKTPAKSQSWAVGAAAVSYVLREFFALCQEQSPTDPVSTEEQHPQRLA